MIACEAPNLPLENTASVPLSNRKIVGGSGGVGVFRSA